MPSRRSGRRWYLRSSIFIVRCLGGAHGLSAHDMLCGYVIATPQDKRMAPFMIPKVFRIPKDLMVMKDSGAPNHPKPN